MNPDFFSTPDPPIDLGLFKSIVGLSILLFAIFVGVEIRIENDDEDK